MIVRIDAAGDPRLAAFGLVGDAAALEAAGLFVAEGRLVVRRLVEDARFETAAVLVTPPAHAALRDVLDPLSAPVYIADQQIVNRVTGFNFHRGCLALARRGEARASLEALAGATRLLALEAVGNPDNIGGLFRTASALGIGGVLLDPRSGDPWYRKAIRTSMAATLRVPFVRADDWTGALASLRARGFVLVALTPAPDAAPVDALPHLRSERLVLMLGAEGSGLSDASLGAADVRARIPVDPRADSLNVVVAAALALYALKP